MDINIVKDWANQNSGFVTAIGVVVTLFLTCIAWTTGFLKWIFRKLKNDISFTNANKNISDKDRRKAGIVLEGKNAKLKNCTGKGPDAGIIDKGESSNSQKAKDCSCHFFLRKNKTFYFFHFFRKQEIIKLRSFYNFLIFLLIFKSTFVNNYNPFLDNLQYFSARISLGYFFTFFIIL